MPPRKQEPEVEESRGSALVEIHLSSQSRVHYSNTLDAMDKVRAVILAANAGDSLVIRVERAQ